VFPLLFTLPNPWEHKAWLWFVPAGCALVQEATHTKQEALIVVVPARVFVVVVHAAEVSEVPVGPVLTGTPPKAEVADIAEATRIA